MAEAGVREHRRGPGGGPPPRQLDVQDGQLLPASRLPAMQTHLQRLVQGAEHQGIAQGAGLRPGRRVGVPSLVAHESEGGLVQGDYPRRTERRYAQERYGAVLEE